MFGASARKKPGDADGERADDREVARQERVPPADDHDRDGEQHRVDGLGDEQVRRALDVGDHAAALGDDARHRRELAVEQHQLRDGTGRRGARAHRHADVGVLQRQRVVHAVAGHGHDVALRLQRADHRPLLLRRDPAEHRVALEHLGELTLVVGQLTRVVAVAGVGQPDLLGDRRHRARVVTRDHLERQRPARGSSAGCRRASGRIFSANITSATGREVGRQRLAVERCVGARQHQRATPARRQLVGPATRGQRRVREHHLRRAHHPGPVAVERGRAPLAGRGERHRRRCGSSPWAAVNAGASAASGRVAVLVVRERAQRGARPRSVAARRAPRARRTRSRPR